MDAAAATTSVMDMDGMGRVIVTFIGVLITFWELWQRRLQDDKENDDNDDNDDVQLQNVHVDSTPVRRLFTASFVAFYFVFAAWEHSNRVICDDETETVLQELLTPDNSAAMWSGIDPVVLDVPGCVSYLHYGWVTYTRWSMALIGVSALALEAASRGRACSARAASVCFGVALLNSFVVSSVSNLILLPAAALNARLARAGKCAIMFSFAGHSAHAFNVVLTASEARRGSGGLRPATSEPRFWRLGGDAWVAKNAFDSAYVFVVFSAACWAGTPIPYPFLEVKNPVAVMVGWVFNRIVVNRSLFRLAIAACERWGETKRRERPSLATTTTAVTTKKTE